MTIAKFIFRSLWYFKKKHLTILLGTALSTAILTGALITGDSVNYSLNQIVEKRLGGTDFALMTGDRYVRNELAEAIEQKLNAVAAAVLSLEGISINPENNKRINKTFVYGIDEDFWKLSKLTVIPLKDDEALIGTKLALKLDLKVGDEFLLRVENVDFIPVNAPFIEEEQPSVAFRLTVKDILDANQMGRFSLKSNQTAPDNVFLSRDFLSERMELSGFVNTLLVGDERDQKLTAKFLDENLSQIWKLADAGLILREIEAPDEYEVVSKRIFMDDPIVESLSTAQNKNEKILTYLVNSLKSKHRSTPYSFVVATSFEIDGEPLKDDEVAINEWLARDLEIQVGDSLVLDYFTIGPLRSLVEESYSFVVKQIVKTSSNGLDNSLMPAFPGLADANSCSDWETSIPIDLERIRDKDEEYWNLYKGTPKAYISIDNGIELWKSSFGTFTSIRFAKNGQDKEAFADKLLQTLNPKAINLQFIPVKEEGFLAANNGVSFGELFLSLSFFVIVAGILLTALLYSLNSESRKSEIGLLSALGFTKRQVLNIQIFESLFVAVIGGLVGAFLGILYNYVIMDAIQSVWSDIVRTNDLEVFVKPETILIGAFIGMFIALMVVLLITRKKLKLPLISLLKGFVDKRTGLGRKFKWVKPLTFSSFGISLILTIYSLNGSIEANSGMLMGAGFMFVVGSIAFVKWMFARSLVHQSQKMLSVKSLALKNRALNQGRSIAVIALLALGSFTILITGANRKTFYGLDTSNASGTGGYLLWAESTMPIIHDLNEQQGVNSEWQFSQFFNLAGDDASCLNLNLVNQPQLLGIPSEDFDKRKSFGFANLSPDVDAEHPWLELANGKADKVISAFVDQTVLTWGLKKKVGDTLFYLSEAGERLSLIVKGGLKSSIFQGNVLIDEAQFRKYFPSVGGSKIMLIDAESDQQKALEAYLNNEFTDFGIEVTRASDRLAEFNSVTNTYLTVFMVLGGLGVLIGTIGLGIVLLRNLLERRHELALLQSLGFTKNKILKIIFLENFFLLIAGLLIGSLAATIGMLPSLLSKVFEIPGTFVFLILLTVFLSGVLWIYLPARLSLKRYLIQSLSGE